MTSNDKFRLEWIAIIISLAAAGFTGLQWWEARQLLRLANDAFVNVEVDTDPSDYKLGFGVQNAGPGIAHIRSVTYYLDGKPVRSIDDVIDDAKLDYARLREIELKEDDMAPGEIVWIARYNARKADLDRATDFFEKHLNVAVEYCSAGGRCATACAAVENAGPRKSRENHEARRCAQ